MSKILKVGDKAYKSGNIGGIQSITVERITAKTAFWSDGYRSKLDATVVGMSTWFTGYDVPQTEQEEKQWEGKIRLAQSRQQAAVLLDKLTKKAKAMSAEELEKLIGAVTPFAGD